MEVGGMSETWYRVDLHDEITEVKVVYSTPFVVMVERPYGYKPRRAPRDGAVTSYFHYRNEAERYIIERAKRNMEAARNDLRAAQERLEKVMGEYA
jgi:hypothetical protein